MSSEKAYSSATVTDALNGEVVLRGPNSVALSMTPDAAEETARRLLKAAAEARLQTVDGDDDET